MRLVLWIAVGAWALGEVVLQLRQVARSDRSTSREWGSYGGIVLSVAVAVLLARLLKGVLPALDVSPSSTGLLIAAVLLVVLGGGFRLWSIVTLGQYFRAVVHIQEGHRVVRSGPYRLLRHPSYTGLLVGLLGVGLLWGNIASTVVFELSLILGVLYRIRVEERMLLDNLGDAYAGYVAHTDRLIPGVW